MKNKLIKLYLIISLLLIGTIGCYAFSFRNMTLDIVQISDTHITDRDNTSYKALGSSKQLLTDAVEQVNKIKGLDFVLFTGDMVDSATQENYYNFYKIISKMQYPSLNAFGNHDFASEEILKDDVLNIVREYNPNYMFEDSYYAFSPKTDYRIIVLDGVIKGQKTSNGELPQEQLEFLKEELFQNQDKVVVIVMHFAPVEPFVEKGHSLLNANEFNELLLKYKNPIVVLSGHYHASKIRRIGNIVYVSTPSMVTYPMGFRHIKITNYKDRVLYNFDFHQTRLDDVLEENRQSVISYATLAGYEKDRTTSFTYRKSHHKSPRYKRNKIAKANKTTKTSKREMKKLMKPKTIEPKKEKQGFWIFKKSKKEQTNELVPQAI